MVGSTLPCLNARGDVLHIDEAYAIRVSETENVHCLCRNRVTSHGRNDNMEDKRERELRTESHEKQHDEGAKLRH